MLDMHNESCIWSKPKVRGDVIPALSFHTAAPFAKKVSLSDFIAIRTFDIKYIFVFGGKNETQNLNEVYSFSTSTLSWARCKYLFVIHIINLISMRL